jgi:predicted RNA-binding protein with TRAM domain
MNDVPVVQDETYEVTITSVGDKGDGIAKIKGFIVIVPGARKGDYVKIKVTKVLEKVSFAKVLEKLEKPVRPSKFVEVKTGELTEEKEEEYVSKVPDTDDFGADLDEE